jgi:SnoaL-like protein
MRSNEKSSCMKWDYLLVSFRYGARATAQTSTSVVPAASSAIEPFRVEISQASLDAERRQAMSYSISTLLTRNLHDVFGENDPARRRAAIDEIFTKDCVFYDPKGGVYRGRDEIDRIAGAVKATHPDFRYQPIAEPEEVGNGGRIQWVSGRPGDAPAYAGTDFIIARDGRIAAVYLFFDKL